jgi:deoxycytidine triphosphate deaminase
MILSSRDIINAWHDGTIEIDPVDWGQLNPNSYDVRLWSQFYLLVPENGVPWYYGPLTVAPGKMVLIPPGMTLLGATVERISSYIDIFVQLRSKSTTRRSGITVCDDAGYGDVGYDNRWTVELTAHAPGGVYLEVGSRFAQVIFHKTLSTPLSEYDGQYSVDWPICMVPKKYRDHVRPWELLNKYSPQCALLPWTKSSV